MPKSLKVEKSKTNKVRKLKKLKKVKCGPIQPLIAITHRDPLMAVRRMTHTIASLYHKPLTLLAA